MHWTAYSYGGRVGHVVPVPGVEAAVALQKRVAQWLRTTVLAPLPDDWFELELSGVELELAGATGVTLGECLFQDYESTVNAAP